MREPLEQTLRATDRGGSTHWTVRELAGAAALPSTAIRALLPDPRDGVLVFDPADERTLRWASGGAAGGWCKLQTVFAEHGLAPAIDPAGDRIDLAPADAARATDLTRITAAMAWLRRLGCLAWPCHRESTSYAFEDIRGRQPDDPMHGVFWTFQTHDSCFDAHGDLVAPLGLTIAGSSSAVREAFERFGVRCDEEHTITPGDAGPAPPWRVALADLLVDLRNTGAPSATWLADHGDVAFALGRAWRACEDPMMLVGVVGLLGDRDAVERAVAAAAAAVSPGAADDLAEYDDDEVLDAALEVLDGIRADADDDAQVAALVAPSLAAPTFEQLVTMVDDRSEDLPLTVLYGYAPRIADVPITRSPA